MRDISVFIRGAKDTHCEDALFACGKFAFVIDGATGVDGSKVTDAFTDAEWYAHCFCALLRAALREEKPILTIMRECVHKIAEAYAAFSGADAVKDKPSAMIALVRERGGMLEYYVLGDAVILLRKKDGRTEYITDDRLVKLDEENFARIRKLSLEKNIPPLRAFPLTIPYILQNRARMNKPGGYGALSHTAEGLDTAVTGCVPVAELEDVLLFSDGLAEAYDLFGLYESPERMIGDIAQNGIAQAAERLFAAQDADPLCEKFLRNKLRDDVSAVYARF